MQKIIFFFRKAIQRVTGICFLIVALAACKQETASPVEMGYEYFPVDLGHWIIYDVDSVVYDDFTGEVNEYHYQVKELIESHFVDGEGQQSIRLERYWRQQPEDPWQVKNVWQARRLPSRLEKTEENIIFLKLAFPVSKNRTWDGNAYNTKASQQYRYENVHEPFQIQEHSFDSVATILQKQLYTLISEDFQQEVYARGVGMVYRKYINISKEIDGTIISGVNYSYSISSFGME